MQPAYRPRRARLLLLDDLHRPVSSARPSMSPREIPRSARPAHLTPWPYALPSTVLELICITWLNRSMAKLSVDAHAARLRHAARHRCARGRAASGVRPAPSGRPAVRLPARASSSWRRAARARAGQRADGDLRRRGGAPGSPGWLPTTEKPPKSRKNRNGAGLIRRSARYSANGGSVKGAEKRWLGTIWNASPAPIYAFILRDDGEEILLGDVGNAARAAAAG